MDAFEKCWADLETEDAIEILHDQPETVKKAALYFFRAGMRAAAAMCNAADKSTHPADLADAILAEADKP